MRLSAQERAGLGLGDADEAGAAQHRQIRGVTLAAAGREGVHGRRGRIVAQEGGQGVEEHRLAVAPGAVDEEQGVFGDVAGERVPGQLPQEAREPRVALRDLVQEAAPARSLRRGGGRNGDAFGDGIFAPGRAQRAVPQIRDPGRRAQQVAVGVPDLAGDGESAVGLGEAFHRRRP